MTIPPDQQEVAAFLAERAGSAALETHISAVFIGADTVWKLKKAIRMPFLDFTTKAARAHFLRREMALNEDAAPGLYRGVTGIVRRPDGALDFGEDDPIDFVLRMARVPKRDFLDVIARESRLGPGMLDALEFDEDLATIDVGYDLAFLLMDLDVCVGRAAANRVMNRYVARTGDAGLVGGLPVFLSQRAMVRAHVLAASGRDGAAAYLAAALGYLEPAEPVVIAIGGLQGTGKSTLARALAPLVGAAPGALVVRSDETRKRLSGVAPEVRLPREAYGAEANAATNAALIAQVRAAAAGHSVIADATFLDQAVREAVAATGRRFLGVWLHAPLAVLEQRIAGRADDASDATASVLRAAARDDPGAGDWLAVEASDGGAALEVVRRAAGVASGG